MIDHKIRFDFTEFNKAVHEANEVFKNFGKSFAQARQREVVSKKARKANSRRLRYTLKAHSR